MFVLYLCPIHCRLCFIQSCVSYREHSIFIQGVGRYLRPSAALCTLQRTAYAAFRVCIYSPEVSSVPSDISLKLVSYLGHQFEVGKTVPRFYQMARVPLNCGNVIPWLSLYLWRVNVPRFHQIWKKLFFGKLLFFCAGRLINNQNLLNFSGVSDFKLQGYWQLPNQHYKKEFNILVSSIIHSILIFFDTSGIFK